MIWFWQFVLIYLVGAQPAFGMEPAELLSEGTIPLSGRDTLNLGRTAELPIESSAPVNDDFERAITITNLDNPVIGTTVGATRQENEPVSGGAGMTVWYRWVAPSDGGFAVLTSADRVNAFSGDDLSTLRPIEYRSPQHHFWILCFVAKAGQEFFFQVDGSSEASFNIEVTHTAPNDDFNARILISGTNSIPVARTLATREPGEPLLSTNYTINTLWWRWIAPATGGYHLEFYDASPPAAEAVFTGSELTKLIKVAAAEESLGGYFVDFHAEAGKEYEIAFGQTKELGGATLLISANPLNDQFENATALGLGETSTNSIFGGSVEPGEISWSEPNRGTFWYSFTAPETRAYLVSASLPSNASLELGAFVGDSVSSLMPVAVNTNSSSAEFLAFRAVAGMNYKIAVAVRGAQFASTLSVSVLNGHPNDDFSNPELLMGEHVLWTNTVLGATTETGETHPESGLPLASVWAKWIAPHDGVYRVVPSTAVVTIFEGATLESATPAGALHAGFYEFIAQAGHEYALQASSAANHAFTFSARLGPAPGNDIAADAIELTGTNIVEQASTWTATSEPGEDGAALWWKWIAPVDGMLTVSVTNVPSLTSLEIFHGNRPSLDSNVVAVIPIIGNPARATTNVAHAIVSGGVEYRIAVSARPATNDLLLKLSLELLEPFSGASAGILGPLFRSGSSAWVAETNVFHSQSGGLETTRNSSSDTAYLEAVYPGPGTLSFWWKTEGGVSDALSVFVNEAPVIKIIIPPTPRITGTNDWKHQTVKLPESTNVVRWTANSSVSAKSLFPAKAWLDDVQFTPTPPLRPRFFSLRTTVNEFQFTFISEANRTYSVEISTNLTQWSEWTNFYSPSSSLRSLAFSRTNSDAVFFRGNVR
jgi:hypothetical protein